MIVPGKYSRIFVRVDEVEQRRRPRRILVWCECDETDEQAIARHLVEHPEDRGCEFITVGWKRSGDEVAPGATGQ